VSPNRRERAYEKRRYQKWQAKLTQRAAERRLHRKRLYLATPFVVVLVIVGVYFVTNGGSGDTASANQAHSTPNGSASASPSASASGPANPCPAPAVKPPATPKSFKAAPPASDAAGHAWQLTLDTSCGKVAFSLDGAKAPQATSAMLLLGRSHFFDGSPCHRLTTQGIYVLQCGDPTGTGTGGPGFSYGPVENAPASNVYPAGTVAMARRGGDGHSLGSQFFLVYQDSTIGSDTAGGYTVLGRITSGLDVVRKVAAGGVAGGNGDGSPTRAISIIGTSVAAG
jgi:peptidyl-prolyl cis-trans isomerase B (cyclophilin B)